MSEKKPPLGGFFRAIPLPQLGGEHNHAVFRFGGDALYISSHFSPWPEGLLHLLRSCNCRRSAIMAINSLLVGLPLAEFTV